MYERQIKRTLYVAKCPNCEDSKECEEQPPRERLCKCGTWVPYVEQSYTGPDTFAKVGTLGTPRVGKSSTIDAIFDPNKK